MAFGLAFTKWALGSLGSLGQHRKECQAPPSLCIHTVTPSRNTASDPYGSCNTLRQVDTMGKTEKEVFFEELYELDNDSQKEDVCDASVVLRQSRPVMFKVDSYFKTNLARSITPSLSLARTISAPLAQNSRAGARKIPLRSQSEEDAPTLSRSRVSKGMASMRPTAKASVKRKRGDALQLMPEAQQIFKGLSFCIPQEMLPICAYTDR